MFQEPAFFTDPVYKCIRCHDLGWVRVVSRRTRRILRQGATQHETIVREVEAARRCPACRPGAVLRAERPRFEAEPEHEITLAEASAKMADL